MTALGELGSAIYHSAIVETLRWRNILIHSSVLIRSSVLRRIGGYHHDLLTDYDLYVRLALAGARFRVIPAELVDVRIGPKALRFAWKEICFRVFCWRIGFLNSQQFLIITLAKSDGVYEPRPRRAVAWVARLLWQSVQLEGRSSPPHNAPDYERKSSALIFGQYVRQYVIRYQCHDNCADPKRKAVC